MAGRNEEKEVCPKCGGDEFYAYLPYQGGASVVVDSYGYWIRDCGSDSETLVGLIPGEPEDISELCTKCEDAEEE